jgi:hypothetical protein
MSLTFENSCQAASDSMSVSEHSLTHTRDRDRDRDRDKDRDRASDSICMSEHSLVQSVAESEKESGRERESLLGAKRDNRGSRAEGGGGGGGGGGGEADRPLSVTTGSRSFKIQDIRATLKPQTLTLNSLSESFKDRHDRDEWDTAGEVYGSQRWTGGEGKFLTGTVAEIVTGTVKGGEAFDRQRGTGGQGNAEVADGGRSRLMLRSRQMTSQSARAMSSSGTAFRSQYTCTHTDRHKHTHAYPSARARAHTHTHTHELQTVVSVLLRTAAGIRRLEVVPGTVPGTVSRTQSGRRVSKQTVIPDRFSSGKIYCQIFLEYPSTVVVT